MFVENPDRKKTLLAWKGFEGNLGGIPVKKPKQNNMIPKQNNMIPITQRIKDSYELWFYYKN